MDNCTHAERAEVAEALVTDYAGVDVPEESEKTPGTDFARGEAEGAEAPVTDCARSEAAQKAEAPVTDCARSEAAQKAETPVTNHDQSDPAMGVQFPSFVCDQAFFAGIDVLLHF